jgi:hypothetical protein
VSEFEIPASYLETEADASKLISYNPTVIYYPESIVEQSVEEGSSQFIHQSSHQVLNTQQSVFKNLEKELNG